MLKGLINVDLLEALRSIVKLKVDHYQSDTLYDILDLANSKEKDYFCFMAREAGTWLFEQKQVYIKDTQANIAWKSYENSDVSTYAVEITNTEILRQYFINHPQSIDKYTFLQNFSFTHWVKEKCSKMC